MRALVADGVSQREIAARLGINRRTVARLAAAEEPPSYSRAPAGSMLDRFEPVMRRLLVEWPEMKAPRMTEILREDYGYAGSVDLVKRRLARMRPARERPAQKTGYRPGQVLQVDWAEMPTRPRIAGRERRVYALICTLPFSGASTAHVSLDMTVESFLEGHVRLRVARWVPRECVYDNLRSAVARRDGDRITWNARFIQLRGHYAFHATACTPATPREKDAAHQVEHFQIPKLAHFSVPVDKRTTRRGCRTPTPGAAEHVSGSITRYGTAASVGRCRRRRRGDRVKSVK
ncbi:helix-turn-helix domain-containing protein [Solirubrobacter soli]|uniref:helix-turn-helix domain-containing protein n=1 Tax=Solirubrobacter soli TaxID=363832 RepID=UPI000406BC7D|nr:helix-turn-helix domain-containing protein [Solirubrobacter soli]